jgi:hypothetical protein
MKRIGLRSILRGPKNAPKGARRVWRNQPDSHRPWQDEKIVMWVGEQKILLRVEDWLRGH